MSFIEDIANRLVSQGVGTINSNIFLSSKAFLPSGNGPYLSVILTGGLAPTRVQNQDGAATRRPTAQILVRASSSLVAETMARAAYTALDGIFNTTLGSTKYLSIMARQEPTDIGLESGTARAMVVFNIEAEYIP